MKRTITLIMLSIAINIHSQCFFKRHENQIEKRNHLFKTDVKKKSERKNIYCEINI